MYKKLHASLILFSLVQVAGAMTGPAAFSQERVVSRILNQNSSLTANNYKQLLTAAKQQTFPNSHLCRPGVTSPRRLVRDVFRDNDFHKAYSSDPVLQGINAHLYFNSVDENVPQEQLPQFIQYVKAFYLLYKHGLVRTPDLRQLNRRAVHAMQDFVENERLPTFRAPKTAEEAQWLQIVRTKNEKVKESEFEAIEGMEESESRFSNRAIMLFAYVAHYQSPCLDPREEAALGVYIGSGYGDLNKYLRENKHGNELLDDLATLINNALSKLANEEALVLRSSFYTDSDMPESVYRKHSVGSIVSYDGFTSTTSSEETFGGEDFNFLIYSKTGKVLGEFSYENEVLFKSHTKFRVRYNSCQEKRLATWQGCKIIMEEIVRP